MRASKGQFFKLGQGCAASLSGALSAGYRVEYCQGAGEIWRVT